MRRSHLAAGLLLLTTSCVYFNAMYDARVAYGEALRLQRDGEDAPARVRFDSVIAMTDRIVRDHSESKYAASAALLKARSELANGLPEAAARTAAGVHTLTDSPRALETASGLEGVALRQLGAAAEADSALVRALAGDIGDDDRALFLFHRGMARLDLGRASEAAEDLSQTGVQGELTEVARLDLARALSSVEQFESSVRLTVELLRANRFANFGQAFLAHVDTLARRAPLVLDSALVVELTVPGQPDTKLGALYYFRGRSREHAADTLTALTMYDSARVAAERSRYGAAASYHAARLRILRASTPADILATRSALESAASTLDPTIMHDALRLRERVGLFSNLVSAYEGRGSTAAEAALRAAEVAGGDLAVSSVARGLYLRYLELAPGSPWAAKAIYGALLYSDTPASDWVADSGQQTDDQLRAMLRGLSDTDPYRISIEHLERDAAADSAYVLAESNLRRRLIEIRMLYDTTAVLVQPQDTVPADADDGQPEQAEEDDGVEF
jgi:tetratricopeptide (TPR) repeat protein